MKSIGVAALVGASLVACGEGRGVEQSGAGKSGAGGGEGAGGGGAGGASRGAPVPEVELADSPRIDLLHNRHRFHLYRDGILLPLASEGLRKYTQEYGQPWRGIAELDGKRGRVLDRQSAVLTFPWHGDGEATVRLWLHGLVAGQRVEVHVNGRRAGVASVGPTWAEHAIPVAAGLLRAGENQLRLHVARPGRAGGARSYALHHALELVDGAVGPSGSWPSLEPVAEVTAGGTGKPALTGFRRMEIYLEVPDKAWLDAEVGAPDKATVEFRARTSDAPAKRLATVEVSGAWKRVRLPLAHLAGQLVALEVVSAGESGLAAPAIALEAAPVRDRPAPYDNLILVVVDALRSDRLSLYGETRVATPRITAEAEKRGAVFLHMQAASPSSPPSHGSIQTGMIPRVHGVTGDSAKPAPGIPTISTQLGEAGVATAYFGNNPFGMARWEKAGRWDTFRKPSSIDCTVLVPEMLGFARKQHAAGKRFFISSLPYEPHTPYRYHEGVSDRLWKGTWGPPVGKSVDGVLLSALSSGRQKLTDDQWQQLFALYDGEVEHWDGCFGQLIDGLAELGLTDTTAVVLTSDHGEGMFEHGRGGHAFGQYAELGNVPLVIYADRLVDRLRPIDTVSSHLDIAPTVLDLMGIEPDERIQGQSVVPMLLRQGPWTPRVVPLEYGRSYALKSRRFKLIADYQGVESLFDHEQDPTEQKDLVGVDHFAHRYLRDVAGFFLAHREAWRMPTWGALNDHGPGFLEHTEPPE